MVAVFLIAQWSTDYISDADNDLQNYYHDNAYDDDYDSDTYGSRMERSVAQR